MSAVCECPGTRGTTGFTNLGVGTDQQWWVHPPCGKPTRAWLEAQGGDEMLNYFQGGPIDGAAYTTTVILSPEGRIIPIDEYEWTPQVKTSPLSGRTARVWVFRGANVETLADQPGASTNATPPGPAVATERRTSMTEAGQENEYLRRRKALGWSRDELTKHSGVNGSQLYRLERGMAVKDGTVENVERALTEAEQTGAAAAPVEATPEPVNGNPQ